MKLASWRPWLRGKVSGARRPRSRLTLESLEVRTAPAVYVVNTFADTVEAVRDGSGLDLNGRTSLRSAIMGANDLSGNHTIQLSQGTYQLTIPPQGNNDDASGNLNVGRGLSNVNLTIEGASLSTTILDAGYVDQMLSVGFFTTVAVRNVTIQNGLGGFGGAVTNAGNVTLASVLLATSYGSHGAGLFSNGTATLNTVFAYGNFASQGGGIHNGGTMTISTSELLYNFAAQGGGLFNAGTLTMNQSTVADNFVTEVIGWGGGIFNMGTMTLTNSTIAQNVAATGGGVYLTGSGTTTLQNCTVAYNAAFGSPFSTAGGIYVGISEPTLRLKNTIVGYNWSEYNAWDISGPLTSLGHNLISDGNGASGFVSSDRVGLGSYIDPRLGPLDYNGGPTRTMALQAGSVAIDGGDNDGAPTVDQRGVQRDAIVDIGAYEFLES